ncbi:MAG: pyridoxamine 5'-phosphate oxidase family protein [Oryzihumus sp.]
MTTPPARSTDERVRDTIARLEQDVDAWVSTADPGDGTPYLVPLSFLWDGQSLLVSTPTASPTGRNLADTGRTRVALGTTRDVVMLEGAVVALGTGDVSEELGNRFAARTGFDPRELTADYTYFRVTPRRVQAWREENELRGRELMRDGQWLGE